MDLFWRILRAHHVLSNRRTPVALRELEGRLECSRATAKRVVKHMRDSLGAPIDFDRVRGGYAYAAEARGVYQLPGLWFNPSELYALLVAEELLARAQPGLLGEVLGPLRDRIRAILASEQLGSGEAAKRVRFLRMAWRKVPTQPFATVAGAVMQRKRLRLRYRGRARDEETRRVVSPQRLVHYKDNWYLDAWDHGRRALRIFALDRIAEAAALSEAARDHAEPALDRHFTESYGIMSGRPRHTALLRFTAERARWVADEEWHPSQSGRVLDDGRYELAIPYSDPSELVLDIMRHGAAVEVLKPASLRAQVAQELGRAALQYGSATLDSESPPDQAPVQQS